MTTNLATRPRMRNPVLTLGAVRMTMLTLRAVRAGTTRRAAASPDGGDTDGYTRWRAAAAVPRWMACRLLAGCEGTVTLGLA